MANPLSSSQFVRLLDKRLREVSENKFKELPSMIPQIYRVLPSEGAFEEFYEIGALPDIPEFTGKLEYISQSPGLNVVAPIGGDINVKSCEIAGISHWDNLQPSRISGRFNDYNATISMR